MLRCGKAEAIYRSLAVESHSVQRNHSVRFDGLDQVAIVCKAFGATEGSFDGGWDFLVLRGEGLEADASDTNGSTEDDDVGGEGHEGGWGRHRDVGWVNFRWLVCG